MAGRRDHLRLVASTAAGRRPARAFRCNRTYGLSREELRRELRRLSSLGWQTWELVRRFDCTCKD